MADQCPTNYPCHQPYLVWFGRKEDWNGDKQKQKEVKELEFKNNNITDPQNPNSQSTSTTDTGETVLAPQLTDTLVPSKKKDNVENNSGDDPETDFDLDSKINNIVQKSEIIRNTFTICKYMRKLCIQHTYVDSI